MDTYTDALGNTYTVAGQTVLVAFTKAYGGTTAVMTADEARACWTDAKRIANPTPAATGPAIGADLGGFLKAY